MDYTLKLVEEQAVRKILLSVNVDSELRERLQAAAIAQNRSMANYVETELAKLVGLDLMRTERNQRRAKPDFSDPTAESENP